ncbi:MAG: hypothetical protein V7750_16950 [Sneathiella sp.]
MVNSVSGNNPVYSAQTVTQAYNNNVQSAGGENKTDPYGDAVQVDVSEGAKTVRKTLDDVSMIRLDPVFHMDKAETRLKELMAELGMPENTEVKITTNSDGSFEVEGDHALTAVIEEKLNDGTERVLSNALKAAHTGTVIQRIAAAVEMASNAAAKDPMNSDAYYNWVRDTVNPSATSMAFEVNFANGTLSGSLLNSEGQKVAVSDGLTLPTA